jgi:hypothetical protein
MYMTALKALSRGFAIASLTSIIIVLHAGPARAQWVTSGATVTNQGPVGIGVTTPRAPLHVEGMPLTTGPQAGYSFRNREAAATAVEDWSWYASGDVARLFRTGRGDRLAVTSLGHVGVGTADPYQAIGESVGLGTTLHLHGVAGPGAFRLTRNAVGAVEMGRITFGSFGYTSAEKRTAAISSWSDSNYAADPTGSLRFSTSNAGVLAEKMRINAAGNVGIGTAAPSAKLHVEGSSTYAHSGIFSAIYAKGTADFPLALTLDGAGTSDNMARLRALNNGQTKWQINFSDDVIFYNWTTAFIDRLALKANGNVGIGTAAPASKLHVAGDVRVDGNISAKYQDVAEWVPTTQKLGAGTVVVLDAERANHVTTTSMPYDTRVAGVVSEQPGLLLGEAGEGKVKVATTGRVRVKVDATRAPVRIGDLLVTSEREGVAMKSEPVIVGGRKMHAPGTIIGKALEPLAKGTGEILVLLSLQ